MTPKKKNIGMDIALGGEAVSVPENVFDAWRIRNPAPNSGSLVLGIAGDVEKAQKEDQGSEKQFA